MSHTPVLLTAAIDKLDIKPDGIYIDATFGRGGHAEKILQQLSPQGHLIIIDKDPQAIDYAQQHFAQQPQVTIIHDSFANIVSICTRCHILGQVDGVLLDLGVSSPQLDQAERGFSFSQEGPLDMRMDPTQGQSVAQWLSTVDATTLADVLWRYGEERFSRSIARKILAQQAVAPITSTKQLASLIAGAVPGRERKKHPATRSFQALRIFINQELADLEQFLLDFDSVLKQHGRVAIITFHSLEDRQVKFCFKLQVQGPEQPRYLPIMTQTPQRYHWVAKKIKPSHNEVEANIRSRSAILRVIEKNDLKE